MPDPLKSILIVDDEVEAVNLLKSILERKGYTVYGALNGQDGIDIIKTKKPDLVFLDVKMPGMTGVDVLSKLKEENVSAKIILVTGLSDGEQIDKARALGVLGVFKKPIRISALNELIQQNI